MRDASRSHQIPLTSLSSTHEGDLNPTDGLPPYSQDDAAITFLSSHRLPTYTQVLSTTNATARRRDGYQSLDGPTPNPAIRTKPRRLMSTSTFWYAVVFILACIIGAIVGGVVGSRSHRTQDTSYTSYLLKNATHRQTDIYNGTTFFDNFDFDESATNETYDSTWVGESSARQQGLVEAYANSTAFMRVQNSSSIRLVSKKSWSSGIFVLEIAQFPYSCRYTPSIRLSPYPSATASKVLTLYQSQVEVDYSRGDSDQYWYTGYRLPKNSSCDAQIHVADSSSDQCHDSNSTTSPITCQYDFISRSSNAEYLLIIVGLDAAAKTMTLWNTFGVWDNSYPEDWMRQINASAIDLNHGSWQKPTSVFRFRGQCTGEELFRDLKLIIDTSICGDYGQYYWNRDDQEIVFTDGSWCENACPPSQKDYYNTWNIRRVMVFEPVQNVSSTRSR